MEEACHSHWKTEHAGTKVGDDKGLEDGIRGRNNLKEDPQPHQDPKPKTLHKTSSSISQPKTLNLKPEPKITNEDSVLGDAKDPILRLRTKEPLTLPDPMVLS